MTRSDLPRFARQAPGQPSDPQRHQAEGRRFGNGAAERGNRKRQTGLKHGWAPAAFGVNQLEGEVPGRSAIQDRRNSRCGRAWSIDDEEPADGQRQAVIAGHGEGLAVVTVTKPVKLISTPVVKLSICAASVPGVFWKGHKSDRKAGAAREESPWYGRKAAGSRTTRRAASEGRRSRTR